VDERETAVSHALLGADVGDIQLELLGHGASRTTSLELVDAYDTDATELAKTAGMRDRMTRRAGRRLRASGYSESLELEEPTY
jgi:hypothetical protein